MALVRSDIITEVETKTKRTDKSTRIGQLLNLVLRKASRSLTEDGEPLLFDCLKTEVELSITDGDYYYALSGLTLPFVYLYDDPEFRYDTDQGYKLTKRDKTWFETKYFNQENNDNRKQYPQDFHIDRGRLYFAPKSDGSYSIMLPYTFLHPEVSSDSDTIYFPEEFLPVLRDGVCEELYDDLGMDELSNKYASKFLTGLRSLALMSRRNSKGVIITDYNDL